MGSDHGSANRIIGLLPERERGDITPLFEEVSLPRGEVIARAGKPLEHVYFLSSGIGSVIAVSPRSGLISEAGMFGCEGFAPTASAVGANSNPYDIVIQVDAHGHRLDVRKFQEVLQTSKALSILLSRYIYVFAAQVSYTALANAAFKIDRRLARWLLMCHDRHNSNELPITHDFISLMLAVRRPSVTTALHVLEGERLIRSERGRIVMRDRMMLEEYARDAYGRPEAEYKVLMEQTPV